MNKKFIHNWDEELYLRRIDIACVTAHAYGFKFFRFNNIIYFTPDGTVCYKTGLLSGNIV